MAHKHEPVKEGKQRQNKTNNQCWGGRDEGKSKRKSKQTQMKCAIKSWLGRIKRRTQREGKKKKLWNICKEKKEETNTDKLNSRGTEGRNTTNDNASIYDEKQQNRWIISQLPKFRLTVCEKSWVTLQTQLLARQFLQFTLFWRKDLVTRHQKAVQIYVLISKIFLPLLILTHTHTDIMNEHFNI